MKAEMLDKAINGIRPELIEEAALQIQENNLSSAKYTQRQNGAVSGVDIYRRPLRNKIFAAAAAIVLVAGAGTGGAFLLKGMKDKSESAVTASGSDEVVISGAPFGDITGGKVRYLSTVYAPFLLDSEQESTDELAEAFNSAVWEKLDSDIVPSYGGRDVVYVSSGDKRFRLVFYGDRTVDYETESGIVRYRVSENTAEIVRSKAEPDDKGYINSHMIPCKTEDLTIDGVWKNNEVLPDKLFEKPGVPEKFKDKEIREIDPQYGNIYDLQDIEKDAAEAEDIIVGEVSSISFERSMNIAYTSIGITVSEDIAGKLSAGEQVIVKFSGGYIPARDKLNVYDMTSNYQYFDDIPEKDIDNICYYEKVFSGEYPIVGMKYAFLVNGGDQTDKNGGKVYRSIGHEYGVLYKYDDIYVQRNDNGLNLYSMDELKKMLESPSVYMPLLTQKDGKIVEYVTPDEKEE